MSQRLSFLPFLPFFLFRSLCVPFALLLLPVSLALSLSLCRCPFLSSVPQLFAVLFCLSLSLCCCPFFPSVYQSFAVLFCLSGSLSCLFCPFLPLFPFPFSLFLFSCCFSLSICLLASHSAAVRSFSLSISLLPIYFVSVLASFLAFVPFLLLFLFFSSFFFLLFAHIQCFCTHFVRVSRNYFISRLLLPICGNYLITNYICSAATRFCSHFKRYFCFSLLFASFLFLQVFYNQYFCTNSVRASLNHLQTSALSP